MVVVGFYVAAKMMETWDHAIFDRSLRMLSGHTLKHLSAAAAGWSILRMLEKRKPVATAKPLNVQAGSEMTCVSEEH